MVLAMMGKPEAMFRICEMEGFLSSIYMVGENNVILLTEEFVSVWSF